MYANIALTQGPKYCLTFQPEKKKKDLFTLVFGDHHQKEKTWEFTPFLSVHTQVPESEVELTTCVAVVLAYQSFHKRLGSLNEVYTTVSF